MRLLPSDETSAFNTRSWLRVARWKYTEEMFLLYTDGKVICICLAR